MPKETFFNLSEEKQDKVMRAAIHEFSEHGFEKGNIGTIAKKAEVAKGSMYQYFDNKQELFMYSVKWSTQLLMKKYANKLMSSAKIANMFDYLYDSSRTLLVQLRDEREVAMFIQDVFLGKYKGVMDDSMSYMAKASEDYILGLIRHGRENGYIRKDIDEKLLCLYVMGASYKLKEHIMSRARSLGEDILDEPFENYEKEVKAFIELIKYGMSGGEK